MKFTISREELLNPLQTIIGVVERRQTLPILANTLVTVNKQQLALLGTDLEVELIGRTELSQPAEAGQVTIPARKLYDICRSLPDGTMVQCSQDDQKVIVKAGRSRFVLQTLPATDFPNIEESPSEHHFKIQQRDFKHLLEQTHFAVAQQDVRYYLNGMLLELNDKQIRTVATDGHRMALCTMPLSESLALHQVIVPRKGVSELLRLLTDSEEEIEVIIGQHHIRVVAKHFTLTSKLIDGRYPDYNKVLPKPTERRFALDRDELKQALNRVAILSSDKFRGIAFHLKENGLILQASNPEHEEAEERLEIKYLHSEVHLGFNVNYLLDVCNTVPAGTVELIIAENDSSLLMEPTVQNQGNSHFVIMPVLI